MQLPGFGKAWGSVSASFMIEQVGVPTLSADGEGELWNGSRIEERLEEFKVRCGGW